MFIVDYASGFLPEICAPDHISVARTQAALRAFHAYPNAKIVLGAGLRERTMGCGPLAEMMHTALTLQGIPEDAILENALGHDTLSETEAAYAVIVKQGGGTIVCATSRYHMRRVWCLWFFRFGITPKMFPAEIRPSSQEQFREYCKLPVDCLRALIHRFTNETSSQ